MQQTVERAPAPVVSFWTHALPFPPVVFSPSSGFVQGPAQTWPVDLAFFSDGAASQEIGSSLVTVRSAAGAGTRRNLGATP